MKLHRWWPKKNRATTELWSVLIVIFVFFLSAAGKLAASAASLMKVMIIQIATVAPPSGFSMQQNHAHTRINYLDLTRFAVVAVNASSLL